MIEPFSLQPMKNKKELTPEQIAARDARRAKFRALSKRIAAMPPDERAALAAKMPGLVTVEGRALSPFNCCLVMFQRDGCTIVGGFRQWLKHGRAVKKGEHGAQIWVPTGAKGAGDAAEMPEDSDSGSDCRFISGTVFDVSQTQEIPERPAGLGGATDADRADALELAAMDS